MLLSSTIKVKRYTTSHVLLSLGTRGPAATILNPSRWAISSLFVSLVALLLVVLIIALSHLS